MSGEGTAGHPAPASGVTQPPADPDAAKYDELRKELFPEGEGEGEGEPEPQPEPKPEPEAEPRAKPSYEELEEHGRKTAGALKAAREAQRASDERLAGIMELVNRSRSQRDPEPKKEEPKLPDKLEDPIGHYDARIAQLEAALQQATAGTQQTQEQLRADQERQQLHAIVVRSEAEILDPKNESHKADYWDACRHLEGQRVKELERMYPNAAPYAQHYARQQGFQDAQQLKLAILNRDRQAVAVQALQLGQSPAQVYYELALDRGYQPKTNGKVAEQTLAEKAAEQIAATRKGVKASVTLSGDTGGRKGANDMSLDDLADLFIVDPEMADKIWEQMAKAGKLG